MTPAIGAGFSRHVCEVMSRSCNGTGLTISAPRALPALSFAGISSEMSITTFAAGIAPPRNTCGAFAAGAIDEMRSVPSSTKADRSERNLFDRLELGFGNHALVALISIVTSTCRYFCCCCPWPCILLAGNWHCIYLRNLCSQRDQFLNHDLLQKPQALISAVNST